MDYYQTLGVAKNATPDEIKKAYRKLASQHHPDKGGDTAMFQKIEEAYRTLSDPQKRQEYDNPQPQFSGFPGGFHFTTDGGGFEDFFSHIFNQAQRQHRPQNPSYKTVLFFTLEDSYFGNEQTVTLNTHTGQHTVKLKVPKGIEDGSNIRYDNIIPNSSLIVEYRMRKHPKFERRQHHLYCELEVSVLELIVGATKEFTAISGKTFEISIKPKTNPTGILKIPGQGMPYHNGNLYGDQIILLKPIMPDTIDEAITNSITQSLNK